jgi:hypothetical protein
LQAVEHRVLDEWQSLEESWHYEGGKRDLRLDLLRGFAALAMIADHIGGESSWLYPITGGNRFFVSAAEAFVFISGAVMGIVYLSVFQKQGLAAVLMKAFHRAWTLYLVTAALTLSFAAVAWAFNLWWSPQLGPGGLPRYVLDVFTLHRTIFLADVLLMYVLMLLAAGPALLFLTQGRTWTVLAASWLLWATWQLAPESVGIPWQIEGNEVFFFPAWQVLFVTGLAIGWHRAEIEGWVRSLPRRAIAATVALALVTVLALYVAQLTNLTALRQDPVLHALAFDKPDLPVGRLVVFALLGVVAFTLTTELWTPIVKASGWLLLPLGQNALTAYSVHIFIVAVAVKLTDTVLDVQPRELVDTALQVIGLGLVWLFVRFEPSLSQPFWSKMENCWTRFRPRSWIRISAQA